MLLLVNLLSIKSVQELSGETCQICGDEVEITVDEELFVACNECAFPMVNSLICFCLDETTISGLFMLQALNKKLGVVPSVPAGSTGSATASSSQEFEIPLLTYTTEDAEIHGDQQAIIVPRSMVPEKDIALYGYGSVAWRDRMEEWKRRQNDKLEVINHQQSNGNGDLDISEMNSDLPMMDEGRQPLSRKLPISSSKISPYRLIIILRLVVLGFFFHYRILHPVHNAYGLWITLVICEIWFAVSWILDQFPKWCPVERETYLDRLSLRYERDFEGGKSSELASVDIFVSTVDPMKEPPLITANTVLSILAVDYPVDKVSCHVSDDGAAMLTFEALSEASEFAHKWVPFCKKFSIEPRAPEWYFSQKMNYLKNKVHPAFVKQRRAMKREYDEFKVQINRLVAMAEKVFLSHDGLRDVEGNELPSLVYVSREKRPGFEHHKKAGAMNALVRVSAVLSNAPYLLNVDCDHYINNSKTLREAMCFMMDPTSEKKVGYVQFSQRFDGMDRHDRYSNRNVVFFDGLDGLQGPMYVGTGCAFRRQALYGCDAPTKKKPPSKTCNCWPKWCCLCCASRKKNGGKSKKDKKKKTKQRDASKQIHALETIEQRIKEPNIASMPPISQETLEKKFGQPPVFVASTLSEDGGVLEGVSSTSLLKEAIHVISCGYEDKTEWERRLDGFMALSQKIYSQGSRCTAVAGAQFTASLRGQHSRDQLPLTSLIVSTRFCDGLLGQSRFS
ncbi:hypothetical protein SASPL_156555 [Salvia splendens]|uniref:Cellulose synthase n=1 Tax=Salvia splendens TaxID=180675 RepID=A0A8X8VWI9_SALSN|nr:hypothetical protein SASPL_156555 [Salvia splendens]